MKDLLPQRVRIGAFEVDLRAGELRSSDRSVVLPEQPFQVLRMLIERSGEVVTRDEIQKKLWPNDTVVEFDPSINAAINKLRQALGDSAAAPKYIETIARRGYRLLIVAEPVPVGPALENGTVGHEPAATESHLVSGRAKGVTLIGKKVSHYRVAKVVGVGGMGLVYEAEDLKLGRSVALKFLPEDLALDPAALQRFEREARAASSLDHPNICTIHEVEEHEGEPFIVMQLLRGETLRDRLGALRAAGQKLSLAELLGIALGICDGLAAAHENGVVHRDIKPANIFLPTSGPIKILDFGVAKVMEAGEPAEPAMAVAASAGATPSQLGYLTETGATMGTAGYMSPEQVRGDHLDARTDLFSLGLVLHEMATGARAFSGETAAVVKDAIQNCDPVPLRDCDPALPPKLESIVNRALEKDRERRYQSAAEMRSDLLSLVDDNKSLGIERPNKNSRWLLAASAAIICVLSFVGVFIYWRAHRIPKLTDQDTIVIADFENGTGDPVFDDTLRQALSTQLSQSPFLNVLPNRKVYAILQVMNRSLNEPLSARLAREVCQHAGSKAMVSGFIDSLHKDYVLGLKAIDCHSGGVLAEAQERVPDKKEVLKGLDEAAITIRGQMGESINSVRKYSTPLEETTQSLEAWKAYTTGLKIQNKDGITASLPFLKRAVEIDPSLARAYNSISAACWNLGQVDCSKEYSRKAYELRDKASERERFAIEANYYENVTGELDKAVRVYDSWRHLYPRDASAVGNFGLLEGRLGNLDLFLEASREALRLEPNSAIAYLNVGAASMNLNKLDEAEEVYKEAEQRKIGNEGMQTNLYELAVLKGDQKQMEQLSSAALGNPNLEDEMLAEQADTERWHGRFKSARKLTQRAIEAARRNDSKETAAVHGRAAALREVAVGNRQQARAYVSMALGLADNLETKTITALVLAQAGDIAEAKKLAEELEEAEPFDTLVQRYWLPMIRSAMALDGKDPNRAVELLSEMGSLELGAVDAAHAPLCPAYLRGEAYLMLKDGKSAAAEFQKFIEHYGLVSNFAWGALARLGLARAYVLEADTDPAVRDKARTAYENFLTLWKDADPDIPIYKQAKAEYAKLN